MVQAKPDIGSLALIERMESLLGNEKASDVIFLVGDTDKGTVERIPAISSLLIASSEVFQAMFLGDLPRPKEERVPDAEAEALRIMLRYVT
ncbi:BTB/POZ domain containing protein [Aphelenchoides avenae]|nr:BTB/POZ domain containing protein [Aphelenchus avenae]